MHHSHFPRVSSCSCNPRQARTSDTAQMCWQILQLSAGTLNKQKINSQINLQMKKTALTYAEIEKLQYILRNYSQGYSQTDQELESLILKLIMMRAEMEYLKQENNK